jgi:hypothetical protein
MTSKILWMPIVSRRLMRESDGASDRDQMLHKT